MSYEPTIWKKGDKVTSTKLNKIENGIQGNDEEITSIKEGLNSLYEIEHSDNLFDGTFFATNGYINGSAFYSSNNYKATAPIYLNAGDYLYPCSASSYGAGPAKTVGISDSNGNVTGHIDATDTGSTYNSENIYLFTAPNAGYYMFNAGNGEGQTSKFMLVAGSSASDFPATYQKYYLYKILTDNIRPNNAIAAKGIVKGINRFDGTVWSVDGFISGGSFTPANNYKTSNPIYLDAGDYLYNVRYSTYGAAAYNFAKCDQNGNISSGLSGTDTGSTITFGNTTYNICKITVADGYYRFNVGQGNQSDYVMVVQGGSASDFPNAYVAYKPDRTEIDQDCYLNSKMRGEIPSINLLNGKKITVNGDSICAGIDYVDGYAKMIAIRNDMSYQNVARAGGTIASGTYANDGVTPRHWICQTISLMSSDADYAILEGGVNDASSDVNVPLGTISSGYDAVLDDTTFYGAMESCLKQLITRFAGKKYGYIAVHQMVANYRVINPEETSYYWAARKCCEKWGVPFLDLNVEVPAFGFFTNADIELYALRTAYTNNGDGWHPNEDGYEKYYTPKIEAWMKTL